MDESATPWRALEAPSSPAGETAPPRDLRPLALAGFGLAVALAVVAFAMAGSSGGGGLTVNGAGPDGSVSAGPSNGAVGAADIVIEISGAVVRPGIYRLAAGSRVGDAVVAAGGYGPRVDAGR